MKNISLEEIQKRIDELKQNPTNSEVLFKAKLDYHKIKYDFQYPIETKTSYFIADFYIHSHKLIIEIDGWIHNKQKKYDESRDKYIKSKGYKIIRIKNEDVDTFDTKTLFYVKKQKIIKIKPKSKLDIETDRLLKIEKENKKKELVQAKLKEINDKKYPNLIKK